MKYFLLLLSLSLLASSVLSQVQEKVQLLSLEDKHRVEVYIDGELFTAYRYDKELEKTILYPIHAPGGVVLSRGYPLEPRGNERVDHPHHVGLWFNFGDVNGKDFWNNSRAVPQARKEHYGRIVQRKILKANSGEKGVLEVQMDWMAPDTEEAQKLLTEHTSYVFQILNGAYVVDRFTRLTAASDRVVLTDNKEGMLAIRVDRAFEHPSAGEVLLTDASGRPNKDKVLSNEGVTGWYRNSEGDEGGAAWERMHAG